MSSVFLLILELFSLQFLINWVYV